MTAVAPLARPARILRLEIRRSAVLWAIPLIAALFFFDGFRTAAGFAPEWTVRSSVITSNMIADFGPFAAGLAAWVASREGRRKIGDLLATTVRPVWARQAAALGATLFWLLLTFLAGVAALYIDVAPQTIWGGPPLWPVVVGVVELVTFAVIGFAAGVLFPGRFTAPLAAIGTFLLAFVGFHAGLNVRPESGLHGLLSPATAVPLADDGVFYHVAPDLAIAQVMFMGGISIALLGVVALAPVLRGPYRNFFSAVGRTGRWLCAVGVAMLIAGIAASWTAFALTGTARLGVSGWDIPALHDAASDEPIPYTPDCKGTTFKVCVHPAFNAWLDGANAALQPAAAEIAGLAGAPVRAEQVSAGDGVRDSEGMRFGAEPTIGMVGTPPVYRYVSDNNLSPFWGSPANWNGAGFQQDFLTTFVGRPAYSGSADFMQTIPTPAQEAVVTALMAELGSPAPLFPQADNSNGQPTGPSQAQIGAAAVRFEALSPAARHAWLATHLPALRAGGITLAQIP
jgi:hypothetical protein